MAEDLISPKDLMRAMDHAVERRSSVRLQYNYVQRIAVSDGGAAPDDYEFTDAELHDLSQSGFSYYAKTPPLMTACLIVELGRPPEIICLTARIVNARRVIKSGQSMMLLGCEFTSRMPSGVIDGLSRIRSA